MAFSKTLDERFAGGTVSRPAGSLDASGVSANTAVLAEGETGYGALVFDGTADVDIYGIGSLQPGTYIFEVSNETWDPGSFEGGRVPSVSLLGSSGNVIVTRDGSLYLSPITLNVTTAGTFSLRIEGNQSTAVQYSASYSLLGPAGYDPVVHSAVSHRLAADEAHLVLLAGSARVDGTGNTHNNLLQGNAGANVLRGLGGSDFLIGEAGNDRLDGGPGEDTLSGDAGNDTYVVDNRNEVVSEAAGSGRDRVLASDNFTLPTGVEHLILTGRRRIDGEGNGLANLIQGNAGENLLHGGGGNDLLIGRGAADFLAGDTGRDTFRFLSVRDSRLRDRDVIDDFGAGDIIDLAAIDADVGRRGNQAFDFIGGHRFSGEAGELRATRSILSGDIDGDRDADFAIGFGDNPHLVLRDLIL